MSNLEKSAVAMRLVKVSFHSNPKEGQCQRIFNICSVQFSCSVVSDSLRPHRLQHTRLPCPSPTPGVHWDSWYFSWKSWFQLVLHPVLNCMMYSSYKLNKQGDNIQLWRTPFLIWNQSVVPCPVLTIAFWRAYRFLRKQVRWSGIPISWRIFYS